MTRPYAEVIGDPVAHSKSPLIHNFWLAKLGIDAEYRACHVRPYELAGYFMRRRGDAAWRGCNVTMPHKQSVGQFIDIAETTVEWAGAVNTIYRHHSELIGDNTDLQGAGSAICWHSGDNISPVEDGVAVLIGTGGAARAAMSHFVWNDCAEIRIIARNLTEAQHLLSEFRAKGAAYEFGDAARALDHADCLVNATPLGMTGQPTMPEAVLNSLGCAKDGAIVFDMVYSPIDTELLRAARSLGFPTVDGLVMLVEQAESAFWIFFNDLLPKPAHPEESPTYREHDAELRALLTA